MQLFQQIIVHRPQCGTQADTDSAAFVPAATWHRQAPTVGEGAAP
jgi:hypothetical protein